MSKVGNWIKDNKWLLSGSVLMSAGLFCVLTQNTIDTEADMCNKYVVIDPTSVVGKIFNSCSQATVYGGIVSDVTAKDLGKLGEKIINKGCSPDKEITHLIAMTDCK